jgi:hypothetical protein
VHPSCIHTKGSRKRPVGKGPTLCGRPRINSSLLQSVFACLPIGASYRLRTSHMRDMGISRTGKNMPSEHLTLIPSATNMSFIMTLKYGTTVSTYESSTFSPSTRIALSNRCSAKTSFVDTRHVTVPFVPAMGLRAVLPALWTYEVASNGKSKLYTWLTSGRSRPRAARSVATSSRRLPSRNSCKEEKPFKIDRSFLEQRFQDYR